MAKYNTHWRNSRHRGTCKPMPCFFCKKITKWRRVYAGQRRYVCYDCIPKTSLDRAVDWATRHIELLVERAESKINAGIHPFNED